MSHGPLQYSEMVDLLLKLSVAEVLINYKLRWLDPRPSRENPSPAVSELGALLILLQDWNLHNMPDYLLLSLQNRAIGWTHDPGGDVIMEFTVERACPPGMPKRDWDKEVGRLNNLLASSISTPPIIGPILVHLPTEDDPPGVQLGLVAKEIPDRIQPAIDPNLDW